MPSLSVCRSGCVQMPTTAAAKMRLTVWMTAAERGAKLHSHTHHIRPHIDLPQTPLCVCVCALGR